MVAGATMVRMCVVAALVVLATAAWPQGELMSADRGWAPNRCELGWAEGPADAPGQVAGKALLSAAIANDGDGTERWPGASLSLAAAPLDWSGSTCLSYWVRVSSDDPEVDHKDISIVVYQQGLDKQQYRRHQVPVGRWVLLRDDISGYERSAVSRINLCMYETQTDREDAYRWELGGLAAEKLTMLDGGWLSAWSGASTARAATASSRDGLLVLVEEAGLAKLSLDGRYLEAAPELPTGFLVRDCAVEGGGWLEIEGLEEAGLKLEYELEEGEKALTVRGVIEDTTGQERVVSVCFGLPVPREGLTWWDDVRTSREVGEGGEYMSCHSYGAGARGLCSKYPIGCITAEEIGGLALATRLDEPAMFRIGYNAGAQRLTVSFDFGLTPAATRFPSRAPFSFLVFRFDPGWGFRAATGKYLERFPEFFTRRAMREGIWMPFTDLATVEDVEDFGFMFHEGNNNVPYDDEAGVYSFRYTEPMSWWMKMPKEMPREYEAAMQEMARVVAEDEGHHGSRARSMAGSAIQGPDGKYDHRFLNTSWCDGARFILNPDPELPTEGDVLNRGLLNYNMEYADGAYGPAPQQHRPEPGGGLDGEYLDSLEMAADAQNYRQDHFAYADVPLTFGTRTLRPCLLQVFSTWEFTKWVSADLHSRGRLLFANAVYHRAPWLAPCLDVGGTETNWLRNDQYVPMSDERLNYNRWLSGGKPYLLLMNTDFHKFDSDMVRSYLKRSLFYGMYPSLFNGTWWSEEEQRWVPLRYWHDPELHNRDRDLFVKYVPIVRRVAQAGWQVITHARSDDPDVWVERWGSLAEGDLHFTVLNASDGMKTVMVTIEAAEVGIERGDQLAAVDLVTGADVPLAWKGADLQLTLQLSAQDCAAVHLGRRTQVGARLMRDAVSTLASHASEQVAGLPGSRQPDRVVAVLTRRADRLAAGGYAGFADTLMDDALQLAETLRYGLTAGDGGETAEAVGRPDARLRRDAERTEWLLTRGAMAALGLKIFVRVEAAPTANSESAVRLTAVNNSDVVSGFHASLALDSVEPGPGQGQRGELPHGGKTTATFRLPVPADAAIGDWIVKTPRLTLEWHGVAAMGRGLELSLPLELSVGVPFKLELEADQAPRQEPRRSFVVRIIDFMAEPVEGELGLQAPEGWEVVGPMPLPTPPHAREPAGFEFWVEVPSDAAPGLYEVRAYLDSAAGRPADRVSNAVPVLYAPDTQLPGQNLAAAAAGAGVSVDSSYGSGYNAAPLTDGVRIPEPDVHWYDAAWASAEKATEHWVQIELPQPEKIGRAVLWWPYDNGWLYASRDLTVQYEAQGRWVDAAEVRGNERAVHTVVDFEPVEARRWRVLQPAGGGPPKRPNLMWLAEVELYAAIEAEGEG